MVNKDDLNIILTFSETVMSIIFLIGACFFMSQIAGLPHINDLTLLRVVPYSILVILGIILLILWLPIFMAGLYYLGHRSVIGMSGHLIDYGIYRYVRNPIYSSMSFIIFGLGLILNNTGIILAGTVWSVIAFAWCEWEIKKLEKKFGKAYLEYKRKTPAFVPNFIILFNNLVKSFHV